MKPSELRPGDVVLLQFATWAAPELGHVARQDHTWGCYVVAASGRPWWLTDPLAESGAVTITAATPKHAEWYRLAYLCKAEKYAALRAEALAAEAQTWQARRDTLRAALADTKSQLHQALPDWHTYAVAPPP